jgi:hypothetical protein
MILKIQHFQIPKYPLGKKRMKVQETPFETTAHGWRYAKWMMDHHEMMASTKKEDDEPNYETPEHHLFVAKTRTNVQYTPIHAPIQPRSTGTL